MFENIIMLRLNLKKQSDIVIEISIHNKFFF